MLGTFGSSPAQLQALEQLRAWTRERFQLGNDAPVLVSELACAVPGCPPLETVVAFWTAGNQRHQFKLFKPVPDVTPQDLPYAWMKNALRVDAGTDCDCC